MADAEEGVAIAASVLAEMLAHPLRVQIINQLTRQPGSAKTISAALGMKLGNVSYHLTEVLFEKCHVIEVKRTIPRRGAMETVYRLDHERLLTLTREASSFFASVFAAVATRHGEGDDPREATGGDTGLAALRVGSVSATVWDDLIEALARVDDRVASRLESGSDGNGGEAIFGVVALRLPAARGAS